MKLPHRALSTLVAVTLTAGCNAGLISGWTGDIADDARDADASRTPFEDDGGKVDGPAGEGTEVERVFFRPAVQQDLVDEGCIDCHQRAGTPMQLILEPGSEDQWRANYDAVAARAGSAGESALIDKATGAGGHGAFVTADSPVIGRWQAWVAGGSLFESGGAAEDREPRSSDAGDPEVDGGTAEVPASDDAVTYTTDIAPIIESNGCTGCHGRAGSYDLSSFRGLMGGGSDDVANVVPGDPNSVLLAYCREGHQGMGYRGALTIMEWVVDWGARED